MGEILRVNGLNIKLNKERQELVSNISFRLEKGKVLGIIGESGSGKTLTCKAIMGLLPPGRFTVKGEIYYKNRNLLQLDKKEQRSIIGKDIAMIMQNPMTAFDPLMKIGHQIIETLQAHTTLSKKEAYQRGLIGLEQVNLSNGAEIMNSYPYTLSGGMLQRIMIAISLMLEPELIIADEATTSLDLKNQLLVLNQFEKIRASGIAMLVVTHDIGVIAKIADDVVVMKNGVIIEKGTVHKIFNAPQADYTRQLLEARMLPEEMSYAGSK